MTAVATRFRKWSAWIRYSALAVGSACFVLTFVFSIVMNGSGGDPLAFALTGLGVFLSILAIVSSEKKGLPIFSLILSLSFPINILLWIIFLFTGVMDFGT